MKVAEIIAAIDELRPNEYSASMKTKWLSECEGTIVDEVLNRAEGNNIEFEGYDYETDQEKETLLPDSICGYLPALHPGKDRALR